MPMNKTLLYIFLKAFIMFIVLYLFIPHPEDGIYNMLDIRIFIGLVLFCICLILDI